LLLDDSVIKNKEVYYPNQDYNLLSEKFKIDFSIKKKRHLAMVFKFFVSRLRGLELCSRYERQRTC
jgi:hypothetical protein